MEIVLSVRYKDEETLISVELYDSNPAIIMDCHKSTTFSDLLF